MDDLCERAYYDLVGLIHVMANEYQVSGSWLMNYDDLTAEGFLTIARLSAKYSDKPYNEFKALCVVSIRNWLRTLRKRAFLTFRSFDSSLVDLQALDTDDEYSAEVGQIVDSMSESGEQLTANPEKLILSQERLELLVGRLNELELRVLDCVLGLDTTGRMDLMLDLAKARKWQYSESTLRITPLMISRALGVDIKPIKQAFAKLRKEVNDCL